MSGEGKRRGDKWKGKVKRIGKGVEIKGSTCSKNDQSTKYNIITNKR